MSMKTMMIGTGVMFAGIAGMAANRLSGGVISEAIAKLRCGDAYNAPVDGVMGDGVCGFNADMHWIAAMAVLFFAGVAINVYGRIKVMK